MGHGQGAIATHITVLGQGVGIAVTFAQLIGSIRFGPQPFAGHDLINGQLSIRRCGNEGGFHRRCLLDVEHISGTAFRCLFIFHNDGNGLGLDGAVQVNGSFPCFGHIRTVHVDTVANGFFAVAEIIFIAGQAQFHFLCGHRNRHGILVYIGHKAGGSAVLGQDHGGSIALCTHVLHGQGPLEVDHIVLIVGDTVFFLCQPNRQGIFDGVFVHQEALQLLTVGQFGSQFQGIFFAVIQVTLEKLGVNRLDGHILLIADHPDICQMLRILKGNCVIMLCRGIVCIHGEVALLLAALTAAKGQFGQPVTHVGEIHRNGTVGNILQLEIVCNMIISILGRHIVIGFAGDQGVLVPVLGIGFPVGGKGHHNTVAVDHFNGNFLIGNKRQGLSFTGLDGQGVGIGVTVCRNNNFNFGFTAYRNGNTRRSILTIHSHGIAFIHGLCLHRHRSGGVQHLVGILRQAAGECVGRCLVGASLVRNLDCGQSGNPLINNGIVLRVGIAVIRFMGDPVDHSIARSTLGKDFVGTHGLGAKSQFLFHGFSGTCHGIDRCQRGNLVQLCGIVLCVSVDSAGKQIRYRNLGSSAIPLAYFQLTVYKPLFLVVIFAVGTGEAERIPLQPEIIGKLHGHRLISANRYRTLHPEAVLLDAEGIFTGRQFQSSVTLIGPHFSVRVLSHNGHTGIIGSGIGFAAIGKADSILGSCQCGFIILNCFIQVAGQHFSILAAGANKVLLGSIVFCFGCFTDILFLLLVVCHGSHQQEQTFGGLTFGRRPLTEAEMGHRRSRDRKVIAAILVTAGVVTGNTVNGCDLALLKTCKGMAAAFQCLTQSLTLGIGNVLRCDHQFSTGFHRQHKDTCRFCRLCSGRQETDHQQTDKHQAKKPQSLFQFHRAFSSHQYRHRTHLSHKDLYHFSSDFSFRSTWLWNRLAAFRCSSSIG